MKILLVSTVPTGKDGITNVIFNYLKSIDGNDILFDLATINRPENMYYEAVESKGGRLYSFDKFSNLIKYIWNLSRLIKQNNYDAVHVHGNSHTICIELLSIWLAGCKTRIIHAHNTSCNSLLIHKALTGLFRMLYTHGLACGKAAGEFMFGKKQFMVVNNGVDTDKFVFKPDVRAKMRQLMGLDEDKILIGHVGAFNQAKNHKQIVEVFNAICMSNFNYRLVLIGDGHLRETVEYQVAGYGLTDKVTFTGNINNVDEYLNAIDIIMMPSLYEGLPLTLIEQQANGLHGVVADTITIEADKTGNLRYVPLDSPIEEWMKVIRLINLGNRKQFSDDAIQNITLAGYNIKEEAKKLKEFYLSLL